MLGGEEKLGCQEGNGFVGLFAYECGWRGGFLYPLEKGVSVKARLVIIMKLQ